MTETGVLIIRGEKTDVEKIQQVLKKGSSGDDAKNEEGKKKPMPDAAEEQPEKRQKTTSYNWFMQSPWAPEELPVEIISLEKENAEDVVKLIEGAFSQANKDPAGGPRVMAVVGGKMIVVRATPAEMKAIREFVANLDDRRLLSVVQLRRYSAEAAASSIRSFMKTADRPGDDDAFQVTADVAENRLLLRANKAEEAEVMRLLGELGEDVGNRGGNAAPKR
jgi:type II secretory pathway component GspD/PulD (secretin)